MVWEDVLGYCLAKPGAWQDEPWEGDVVAKVGSKIFAFLGSGETPSVGLKCGASRDDADEWLLRYPDDARVMPYIGRSGWNTLLIGGAIGDDELTEAVDASYAAIVSKLPRKDRPAPRLWPLRSQGAGRRTTDRSDLKVLIFAGRPGLGRNVAAVTVDDDDAVMGETVPKENIPPGIPVSSGALIFDRAGRLLILKPTYKSGWTIPGGVMEADGETPWDACRREVREECGIEVHQGRLACMDFRRPGSGRPGGIRFLFDCGQVGAKALNEIVLQPEEISEYRLAALPDALELLRKPIRRRVRAATKRKRLVYLESGRPVSGAC